VRTRTHSLSCVVCFIIFLQRRKLCLQQTPYYLDKRDHVNQFSSYCFCVVIYLGEQKNHTKIKFKYNNISIYCMRSNKSEANKKMRERKKREKRTIFNFMHNTMTCLHFCGLPSSFCPRFALQLMISAKAA
jgi:hypothetical protein